MKRAFAIILALVMILPLCGCKSDDYEEALQLYNNGNYKQARAIFLTLEDYKDSKAMAEKCAIERCIELLDDIADDEHFYESDVRYYEEAYFLYNDLSSSNQALVTNAHVLSEREIQYKQGKAEPRIKQKVLSDCKETAKLRCGSSTTYRDHPEYENKCYITWDEENPQNATASVSVSYLYENIFGGTSSGGRRVTYYITYDFETGEFEAKLSKADAYNDLMDFFG